MNHTNLPRRRLLVEATTALVLARVMVETYLMLR